MQVALGSCKVQDSYLERLYFCNMALLRLQIKMTKKRKVRLVFFHFYVILVTCRYMQNSLTSQFANRAGIRFSLTNGMFIPKHTFKTHPSSHIQNTSLWAVGSKLSSNKFVVKFHCSAFAIQFSGDIFPIWFWAIQFTVTSHLKYITTYILTTWI